MPQLDVFTFFNQLCYFLTIFFSFYFFSTYYFIPSLRFLFLLRVKSSVVVSKNISAFNVDELKSNFFKESFFNRYLWKDQLFSNLNFSDVDPIRDNFLFDQGIILNYFIQFSD